MKKQRRQFGATTVEFAIVGSLLMLLTLAVIEVGRLLFTYNLLSESTRRAARVAAVCFPDGVTLTKVQSLVNFGQVPGLTSTNIQLDYLNSAGSVIAAPATNFLTIRYVRVRIVGFDYQMYIPFMPSDLLATPEFAVTLPRESLGVPRSGVVLAC